MNKKNPFYLVTIFFTLLFSPFVTAEINLPDQWNLTKIYPSTKVWDKEIDEVKKLQQKIRPLANQKLDDAETLLTMLEQVSNLRAKVGKLAKVSLLQHFVDTKSDYWAKAKEHAELLESQVENDVAFLAKKIRAIPEHQLDSWYLSSDKFLPYVRRINRIKKLAPFQAPPGSESIISDLSRLSKTANDFYSSLTATNLHWPIYEGKPLTISRFRKILRNDSLIKREEAGRILLPHLAQHQDLFALALTRRIEGDTLIANHKNLLDSIDQLLVLQDGFEPQSYQKLFSAINKNTLKIQEIGQILAKAKQIEHYQVRDYRSLLSIPKMHFSAAQSHSLALQAAKNIGEDYHDLMAERLKKPWMHLADNEYKSNTVGVFWQVGGGNPHTIFKYKNDYISSRLYSSAAFLMMGLANIPDKLAPDRREEDLPVYSNSLWYLGDLLHAQSILKNSNDKEYQKVILTNSLSRIYNTLFNYSVMIKLESKISEAVKQNSAVTANDVNQWYFQLISDIAGDKNSKLEDHWKYAWMLESFAFYGPHYASFYQAITAALSLKQKILNKDPIAIEIVKNGIANSDTHFSADVLKAAGIDMNKTDTYEFAINSLHIMAKQLESYLK